MSADRPPQGFDEAAGNAAAADQIRALLAACLRRVDAFPLDSATEPAWRSEEPDD